VTRDLRKLYSLESLCYSSIESRPQLPAAVYSKAFFVRCLVKDICPESSIVL